MGPGAASSSRQTPEAPLPARGRPPRGAMDYLTQVPQNISHSIPESLESYGQRAAHVSSVLDEILHQHAPPPLLRC